MSHFVYLAEKPKMARVIADALSIIDGSKHRQSGMSYKGNGWTVCWLAGHAYELFAAKDYCDDWAVSWDALPLPLIPEEFKLKPIEGDFIEECRETFKSATKTADTVVIATDPGQEGQIIAEIMLDKAGWHGNTMRLWSSSQNPYEMVPALKDLKPNADMKFQGLKLCGLARMHCDWLIGINFTVQYTNMARKAGYDFVASAGRVQSCILSIVVDHDAMVDRFQSSSYFDVEAILCNAEGESFEASLEIPEHLLSDGKHCIDKNALLGLISNCQDQKALVSSISNAEKSYSAPKPFTLTSLCIAMSREFGISSKDTSEMYQKMYEAGWLTYTRPDDPYYENKQYDSIDKVFGMLRELDPELMQFVDGADTSFKPAAFNSSAIEEHGANSPTTSRPKWETLDQGSRNIYKTVAKQMIAQFYPDYKTASTRAEIRIGGLTFNSIGHSVLQAGWSTVIKPNDEDDARKLPSLSKGELLNIVSLEIKAKKTRAPARMTEARILEIMEDASGYLSSPKTKSRVGQKAPLGTAATRPDIPNILINKRKVLAKGEKGILRPTKLGKQIRSILPEELSSPDLSVIWEKYFNAIRRGQVTPVQFISQTEDWVRKKIHDASKIKLKRNPLTHSCTQDGCTGGMVRREFQGKSPFWKCLECNHIVNDHEGKPLEKLPGDGSLCPECNQPFKTFVRNKNKMSLEERRKTKDLRYMRCPNGHYPPRNKKQ